MPEQPAYLIIFFYAFQVFFLFITECIKKEIKSKKLGKGLNKGKWCIFTKNTFDLRFFFFSDSIPNESIGIWVRDLKNPTCAARKCRYPNL